ncbi:TIGR00153 family protein [Porticoccus sp. W117]|uniref:TIGR00153 family protein n=1 Tax=Porticoccus sp. W117 TaxID=3054777 RepID=UPI0025992F7D|nr:TIGR00153 family protein [Porticoccus sp. W117]MDM3870884.1 TIGR00153 family protein [Porticoccus sp. W117]
MTNPFASLFGKSPIKPLQEHMTAVVDCAQYLAAFFDAAIANDWKAAANLHEEIGNAEHRADELKKQLRLHLPKSLFMPMSRSDLLELLSVQDRVANAAKDISGIMLGRQMTIPEPLQGKTKELVAAAIAVAAQALKAIKELDELLETGFSGGEIDIIEQMIERLDELEDTTDGLERELRHKLFVLESELPPVEVMFLYQIIGGIGAMADQAERVGGRLQLLLAR